MTTPRFRPTPLAAACLLTLCSGAMAQAPLPTGGQIVQGTGSIASSGSSMTITQGSSRLIADWQSFSIGSGASVRFVQPSSSSVALNRVTGGDPSRIFGTLSANGHVVLQNAAGVLFAPGAQVDVGALVATTLNADAGEFMAGRLRLAGDPLSTAAVRNEGTLKAAPGGHVVLAGAQVSNTGTIDAPFGTAALAAGSAVEIDPTGAGLLSIRVPAAAVQAQLASSGRISADGGLVALQAAAVDAGLRTVMNVDGVVRARSIEQRDGQILLGGGSSGVVRVDGTLDASGPHGGRVQVLGERVALAGAARLDASGDAGGGTVLVGGNLQGRGPQANATDVYVGPQVVIDISARLSGDGGTAVVWADGSTRFAGEVRARGAGGGDGGFAEVSGKRSLAFQGRADLRAPGGAAGTLLLDPFDLFIADGGTDITGDILFGSAETTISPASVASLLATGNLLLQANNSINVDSPLTVAAGGAATTLTLQSPAIAFNAPTTLNQVALVAETFDGFSAGQSLTIAADLQSLASVTLRSNFITVDDALLSAPRVRVETPAGTLTASIGQTTLASVQTDLLEVFARTADGQMNVNLLDGSNRIGRVSLDTQSASVSITNAAGSTMAVDGTVAGALTLQTNSTLTQTAALTTSSFTSITTTAGSAVTLTNAANAFGGPLTVDAGGALSLAATGPLSLAASAAGPISVDVAGTLSLFSFAQTFVGPGLATSAGDIGVRSAGFVVGTSSATPIVVPTGNRFVVESSDYTLDSLGTLAFGTGPAAINNLVLGSYPGTLPAAGNTYVTNATGTLSAPIADTPAISRVYDATTDIAFAQSGSSAGGVVQLPGSGAPATVALGAYSLRAAGQFDDKNVGTGKGYTVFSSADTTAVDTQTGVNYYGLSWGGYVRAPGAAGPVSEVTPRAISATGLRGIDRVYDGTTSVAIDGSAASLVGVLAGDTATVSVTGASGTMADRNVGTSKPLASITGVTAGGTDGGNYVVTDPGSATVTITPLTIAATGLTGVDRVYDAGTAVAVDTATGVLSGVLSVDLSAVTLASASGTMADKNAGLAKPVNVDTITLAGAAAGNYVVAPATTTVNIAPRAIAATGLRGVDRVYDGTISVAIDGSAASLVGVLTGDTATVSVTGASGTMADRNAGTNKPLASITGVTAGGADGGNYVVADAGSATVTISPRAITAAGFAGVDRPYDGTTAVAVNSAGASLTGVLPVDAVTIAGASGTMADKNVGTAKPVTVGGVTLAGDGAGNYVVGAAPTTVTITPRTIAAIGLDGVDRVYDGTTAVAIDGSAASLSGVLGADQVTLSLANATASVADKNVGTAKPVSFANLGLAGGDAANYRVVDASEATVAITPLAIAPAGIVAKDRVVDGTTTVQLVTSGATLPGVLAGDVVTLDASGASGSVSSPDPGRGKTVFVSGLQLGGSDAANYALLATPVGPGGGGLTVRILTVPEGAFEEVRYTRYLEAISDAQEPFRRAMAEALASGFGKENIRKQLARGLVFETGLAPPAVDDIQPATPPQACSAGAGLACSR